MKPISGVIVLALLLAALPAPAQPPGGPPHRPFERIERLRKVRLIEMLELNEEQSIRFFARLNEYERARRDLHAERMAVLDKLERLVRNPAEEGEYDELFSQITAIDDRMGAEKKRFFSSLSDMLSPEQRAKFLLFERRFDVELREAMREVQRRRHGGTE